MSIVVEGGCHAKAVVTPQDVFFLFFLPFMNTCSVNALVSRNSTQLAQRELSEQLRDSPSNKQQQ
jgi:hypothetical protein